MNQPLQSIIQHLFQVNSLEDVSRQRLESFVEEYPSFGIGHYLLSHKLRAEDPDRFGEATQRTGLYFSNPLWLQWLLENAADGNGRSREAVSPVNATSDEAILPVGEPQTPEEPDTQTADGTIEEPSGSETPEAAIEQVSGSETSEAMIEEPSDPENGSAADRLLLSIEEAKGLRESLLKINDDFRTVRQDEPIHDEESPYVLDESDEAPEAARSQEAELPEPIPATEPASSTPAPIPATATPPGPDLVFEPYHTIDYFASQGIRLKLDENPGDALGKQLKSFTDWLKVMRRLPQKERESSVPDRVAEQAIQTFAAHSIQSKDIVTETMAEVLIMQGMRDRARAIYEKLSLLDPDKKAYFAAKIEQLNIP